MLKSFDRYVLKEIASPFGIGLAVYTFTLLTNNILLLSKALISKGAPLDTVLKILVYFLPDILSFTIPMTTLMGILAGLSRMSTDSEIVALRTMGMANVRLLKPVMLFSCSAWLFSSWLIMYIAPETNYRLNKLITGVVLSQTMSNIKPGIFYQDLPSYVLYIQDIDSRSGEWKNVFVYSMKSPEEDTLFLAKRGQFIIEKTQRESYLALFDGVIHSYKKATPEKYTLTLFSRKIEKLSNLIRFKQTRRSTQLIFPELLKKRKEFPQDKILQMEFHNKFTLPFACLGLGFLGLSLGISTKKGGKISGFIISLGIIFVLYILITLCRNLILKNVISPLWGMWLPNFFLVAAGIIFYRYASREKEINWDRFSTIVYRGKQRSRPEQVEKVLFPPTKKKGFGFLKVLDTYVLKKMALMFFLIFSSLMLVFYIITIIELINDIIENKIPFFYVLQYVYYNTPEMVSLVLPISVLTTVLLTFSLMSKNNEIVAIQVSGISLHRLALPAVYLGLLFALFSFWLQEKVQPPANEKASQTLDVIHNRQSIHTIENIRNWAMGKNNEIYFCNFYDRGKKRYVNFNILHFEDVVTLQKRISAKYALWENGGTLRLQDATVREFDPRAFTTTFTPYRELRITTSENPNLFSQTTKHSSEMTISELKKYIRFLKDNHSDTTRAEAQLNYKYAFPLTSLVMALLAIPFSFRMGNRGALYGIGIAVAISMIFWGSLGTFSSLGSTGVLTPFFSAFIPPLAFAAISFFLLLKMET